VRLVHFLGGWLYLQSPWGRALHLASPPEQMSKCVSCASDTVIVENLLIHVISRVRVIISMTGLSIFSQILRLCRQALELQATHVEYQTLRLSRCCLRYTCVCAESDWMMCNNYSHAGVSGNCQTSTSQCHFCVY